MRRGLPPLLAAAGVGTAMMLVANRYEPGWVAEVLLGASLAGRGEFELHRGEALLLYTDGIGDVERPSQVPVEDRLAELLRLCVGLDAELMANRIERHALSFESASDDAAVLVIRIPEPPR